VKNGREGKGEDGLWKGGRGRKGEGKREGEGNGWGKEGAPKRKIDHYTMAPGPKTVRVSK